MIRLRPAEMRLPELQHEQTCWHSFGSEDVDDPLSGGLGALVQLDEHRMAPGTHSVHGPQADAELVTFVREGSLAYADAKGRSGTLNGGEFQRRDATATVQHHESNPSPTRWAHVFRIGLHPAASGLQTAIEQERFSTAQRRSRLCVVASLLGDSGSLRLQQDARIYSSVLRKGRHVVHALGQGRCVWVHIVQGEVAVNGRTLRTGDGAAINEERAVSLTAHDHSEFLLIDLDSTSN